MTQLVKLKRSSTASKIPQLNQIELGELAINTFDGRMFMKRDNGAEALVEILTELSGLKLSGGTLTGSLILSGNPSVNMEAATKQYVDSVASGSASQGANITANSNTTYTIDIEDGDWRRITFSSNCTLAFTIPASTVDFMILEMVNAGAYLITWPAGIKWNVGVAPNLTAVGTDLVVIMKDGNENYYGSVIAQAIA